MINMYAVLEVTGGTGGMYWYVASFARMFGAALFGLGFVIWAASSFLDKQAGDIEDRRRFVIALVLANGIGLFVAAVQQASIWANVAGWITIAIFLVFLAGYLYFLTARRESI